MATEWEGRHDHALHPLGSNMRNLAKYRKAITIGLLGLVELAAYIAADPRDLPPWVVAAAAIINTIGVLWVRNDRPVTREDLKRTADYPGPTRFAGPEDRGRFGGGP
jgi:hypothetical protein